MAMDDFKALLLKISGKLNETDLHSMKFLCQDKIPKRKMETIMSPTDLFTKLMELEVLSKDNPGFLVDLLKHVDRHDLAKEFNKFQIPNSIEEVSMVEGEDEDQLDEAFNIICENVGRDWKMLIRTLGIGDSTIDQVVYANPYNMREQLRQCLREWKKKKREQANVYVLKDALTKCRMKLVAERLSDRLNLSLGES